MPTGSAYGWGVAGTYLKAEIAKLPPVDGVTLHCITGHNFMPFDETAWSRINIGYCFFEHDLLARPFIAEAAGRWDHVVAGSSWCEQHLRNGGMERTSTILQGIDSSLFCLQLPRSDDSRFIVFSGGKFEYRKGQDIVIAAMRLFMERHKDVWLSCSWHNQWPSSIRTMEQSQLIEFVEQSSPCFDILFDTIRRNGLDPERVLLHPPFDNSRMPLIYAESDVGLFPNRCEGGNNMVMCEYMACGRTAIASNQTGHADVVTPENALCLSSYHSVTAKTNGHATGIWPEPSVGELLDFLELAYHDRNMLAVKGAAAARDMSMLTWSEAARRFHALAERLVAAAAANCPSFACVTTHGRGKADDFFEAGCYEEAEACYRSLLVGSPLSTDLLNSLATTLDRLGRYPEALAYYNKVLTLQPTFCTVIFNMANTLARAGELDEAIAKLYSVVATDPCFVEAWQNLGNYHLQKNQPEEAVICFKRVTTLNPGLLEVWIALAHLHEDRREFAAAVSCFEAALDITPGDVGFLNSKGLLLHELGELDGAETAFLSACAIEPRNPVICNNLGNVSKSRSMMQEALAWYDRALEYDPDNATIIFNRSLVVMALGDLLHGWQGFERRFDMIPPVILSHQNIPVWDGSSLNGRRLLIQSEQVYGDTIMFARFIPLASRCGGPVVFECQDESILKTLGALNVDLEALVVRGTPLPPVDAQIPLLSLPRIFDVSLENIPGAAGYLHADKARSAFWKERICHSGNDMRVGLVWSGRKAPLNADRSMALSTLETALMLPGVRYFSLQLGEEAIESGDYACLTDLGEQLQDFGETAAVIANMDLVISIDTAVAHLAGAMGVPVWIMLKHSPDWRWQLDRPDSPWYASARLFRQDNPGDWASVVHAITAALKIIIAERKKN
ncbi:MAG: tetratricopeptide repeat protein [Desulfuromonadaceae bacterium]|nr:tetratricopeptide repeat protein [Desulfuromonadaceae bacterium]MDD2849544.1 tetratricopeptide repeat protein [Desulfuromonadaceae bacterium]MDD4131970.1 tetratricopeptide repeat protein [Desulfuromonadaceae bacterium]